MTRAVTIFTGQWANYPLAELAPRMKELGYDGLELCCWGDHFDVFQGAENPDYCDQKRQLLSDNGLNCWAISNHLAGQLTLDPNDDTRSNGFGALPPECDNDPEAKRAWGIASMKASAKAAKNLGVKVVNGFTGSPIWHFLYSFPAVSDQMIDDGFRKFAQVWIPILDEFDRLGINFALEVHPTEIAFDLWTAKRALEAIGNHPRFGFNFDPSHLLWQGIDPAEFIRQFPERIFHVHIKDCKVMLDGRNGILGSHLAFGASRRGWDFRSPGHGQVNFEEIIRELNRANYQGPLSVEWEDAGMDQWFGAADACAFTRRLDFAPAGALFDAAFKK
ncbi:MAG: sugar phosphate isomerase/epimerase [Victivallales bacterium]|nr:sugar phosphate isomerase/epimerase [Victivallales bacterium]